MMYLSLCGTMSQYDELASFYDSASCTFSRWLRTCMLNPHVGSISRHVSYKRLLSHDTNDLNLAGRCMYSEGERNKIKLSAPFPSLLSLSLHLLIVWSAMLAAAQFGYDFPAQW